MVSVRFFQLSLELTSITSNFCLVFYAIFLPVELIQNRIRYNKSHQKIKQRPWNILYFAAKYWLLNCAVSHIYVILMTVQLSTIRPIKKPKTMLIWCGQIQLIPHLVLFKSHASSGYVVWYYWITFIKRNVDWFTVHFRINFISDYYLLFII